MRHHLGALLLLVAGCAGETADAPDTATSRNSTPPPTAASDGFGLHDTDGPVPGLDGFSFVRTPDATHCGGFAVSIVRAADATVAPDNQELVDLLTVRFPHGLDFSDATRDQAKQQFDRWLADTQQRAVAVFEHIKHPPESTAAPAVQLAADARAVLAFRFFAGLLLRAEMPVDVRTGDHSREKQDAFCDALATAAEPLLVKANELATACARLGSGTTGWWTSVCAP